MELNPQQQEAVTHTGSPLLIVAGAGSGKTRTLTERVLHILRNGVPPERLLAITFTNKAAKEMKERIEKGLGNGLELPFIGTFHSFGARLLRREASALGRTVAYSIFDEDDALSAAKTVIKNADLSFDNHPPAELIAGISKIKNELLNPEAVLDGIDKELFDAYEHYLERNNAFDFDDLIEKVVMLFRKHPEILHRYETRFQHILVDEYQDVNTAQYTLVRLLGGKHQNVSVVGDDAQAIYAWRGADFRNFLNFEKDWPRSKVVFLDQNYRSCGNVIAAASALIQNNKFQKPKNLWTQNDAGALIKVIRTDTPDDEAEIICKEIMGRNNNRLTPTTEALRRHGWKPLAGGSTKNEEIKKPITQLPNSPITTAILYRTNAQSRAIEQTLIAYDIPYHIFGGLKFYDRKEIKDIVAALRIAANPRDEVSKERLTKTFPVAVGRELIAGLLQMEGKPIVEVIGYFLSATSYFEHLKKKFKNLEERKENIQELISFAGTFVNVQEFLERVSLLQSADAPARKTEASTLYPRLLPDRQAGQTLNPINLMTIHLAKGLEFDRVFVAGASEGTLPHFRSFNTLEELEEERRLMYVAMTRARNNLTISFTNIPSRFLYELPSELTEFTDLVAGKRELPDEDERYLE